MYIMLFLVINLARDHTRMPSALWSAPGDELGSAPGDAR
jgi:hypothetical protein